jgi:acetyl esterase/lipase
LDRHGIVWVGADLAGNARNYWDRYALALDALENVRYRFWIDPNRSYIGGFSGGGRCASALALVYGDLFAGGLFVRGCDAYLPVPIPSTNSSFWRPQFPAPASQIREKCRAVGRYVSLPGEHDFNRDQARSTAETMRKDGFSAAEYMEIPGLDHALPGGKDFERALAKLDPMN